ncbi:hypothetical protein J6590_011895 [Homalodisca vitripennis]|nr:hypothetical protein J6590_011895 [Homalodisca vitripennis]
MTQRMQEARKLKCCMQYGSHAPRNEDAMAEHLSWYRLRLPGQSKIKENNVKVFQR